MIRDERFPGYLTEKQAIQQAAQNRAIKEADSLAKMSTLRRRYADSWAGMLVRVLPLLREHAMDKAYPTEIVQTKWFGPFHREETNLVAGWVVLHTFYDPRPDLDTDCTVHNYYTLTENGLFGNAGMVDRGVKALEFPSYAQPPQPLSTGTLLDVLAPTLPVHPGYTDDPYLKNKLRETSTKLTQGVTELLGSAAVDFNFGLE